MNLKNKYFATGLRVLFGLFMLFSGAAAFFAAEPMKDVPEVIVPVITALQDSGIYYMIKFTEIIAGAMLVFNFLPALAAIFLAPVAVGILVFNIFLSPEFIAMGVAIVLVEAYFGYLYWDKYKALFKR